MRIGGGYLFWAAVAVDSGVVACGSAATGARLGCDDVEETVYGAGNQRGLSRLCYSGGVESGGR
ncbi:MAG TPA: hypothetical protein VNW73_14630 [Ktedonobacteraceae bacterium]|nr:hypothetical protein [Ktedonobacteraceae bacterium]